MSPTAYKVSAVLLGTTCAVSVDVMYGMHAISYCHALLSMHAQHQLLADNACAYQRY